MIFRDILQQDGITLRCISLKDVTKEYVAWLNDKKINRYMECRFQTHTLDSIKSFVVGCLKSPNNYLFAIIYNDKHIGNIKLGSIDSFYQKADVGYFIGETKYFGKGIATKSLRLVTKFAFDNLHLHRLWGGAFADNVGSQRVFLKAGYTLEGKLHKAVRVDESDSWQDSLIFGIINDKEE